MTLAGFSLGGWIAAEVAVRCAHRLSRLILVSPVGIKAGDRETRDIPDIFALPPEEVTRLVYHDPRKAAVNYAAMSDERLRTVARNRQSLALYTWEPYMHNPKLRYRIGRLELPVLLIRGTSDSARKRAISLSLPRGDSRRADRDDRRGRTRPANRAAARARGADTRVHARSGRRERLTMRTWFFTETAWPYLPDEYDSIRVTLPDRHYDPHIGAELYHRYLDEWLHAEHMGLDLMLNEHHQTATCLDPAAPIMLGVLARQTSRARLLLLGNPIANRRQPVRVAEEMAMVDNLARGRIEVGFVRGVPYEISAGNTSPLRMSERFWEAHDLILKAWTTHDGPFSWEGRFFHHRQVNIWPRPYQQPYPPVWITALSAGSVPAVAERGYVVATL